MTDETTESPSAIVQQLREREERLRSIMQAAGDAIITIDRRGTIIDVNPATTRLFGYSEAELLGNNVKLLMPPPYRDEHDGYIARYLQTREARIIGIGREISAMRKDGTVFPVSLAVSEVDHLQLFTGIIRDETARKSLERDVLEIAAEEDRRIGHELHDGIQQDIAAMTMFAGALLKTLEEADPILVADKEHRMFDEHRFANACEQAQRIVNGLSATQEHVRRLARGIVPLQIDAHGLQHALSVLASAIDAYEGVSCRFETPSAISLPDSAVATHLYRIAQEATNNALRHSHADEIVISLTDVDGHLILEVRDNGVGCQADVVRATSHAGVSDGIGIRAMQYRASLLGAVFDIGPGNTGGTLVRCSMALD